MSRQTVLPPGLHAGNHGMIDKVERVCVVYLKRCSDILPLAVRQKRIAARAEGPFW